MIGITYASEFLYFFMAMFVNCTTGMERKSKRTDVVVAALEKYLGIQDFTAEELQDVLNNSVSSSQARIKVVK